MDLKLRDWPAMLGAGCVVGIFAAIAITIAGKWASTEAAAWVQAFGSVAAILITGYVAQQAISANRLQEAARYRRRMQAYVGLFDEAADEVAFLGEAVLAGQDDINAANEFVGSDSLQAIIARLDAIPVENLESREAAVALLSLRSNAQEILMTFMSATEWGAGVWDQFAEEHRLDSFRAAVDQAQVDCDRLRAAICEVELELGVI